MADIKLPSINQHTRSNLSLLPIEDDQISKREDILTSRSVPVI